MDQIKSIFASKTIWANLIAFVALIYPAASTKLAGVDPGQLADAISQLVTGAGVLYGIYARFTATKQLVVSTTAASASAGTALKAHPLVTIVALGVALLMMGACNATTPGGLTLASLGADIVSAYPSTAPAVAKVEVTASKVAAAAKKLDATACHGIVPAVESVTAIIGTASGTVASVEAGVAIACKALDIGVAYAANDNPAPVKRKLRKGETVTGTAVVNGKPVPVSGTVAK